MPDLPRGFWRRPTWEGFGVGRFGKGGYGIGEQSINLYLSDGTKTDALSLVERIFAKWTEIFNRLFFLYVVGSGPKRNTSMPIEVKPAVSAGSSI